jgi:hypothetical protein
MGQRAAFNPELFPKMPVWIVRQHDGRRILDVMQWGVLLKMTAPGSADRQEHILPEAAGEVADVGVASKRWIATMFSRPCPIAITAKAMAVGIGRA